MKKKTIILQCIVLVLAVLIFVGYNLYVDFTSDTKGPEIHVPEEILELTVEDPQTALLQGITARDNRDGDVTDSVIVENVYGITDENVVTVTYAAFDRSGNVTKATRQVRYTDYHSPVFELNRSLAFSSGIDIMNYIGATDVFEGDISRRVRGTVVSETGSLNTIGRHEVEFQVYNSIGDTVKLRVPVEVYSPDKYNAKVELKENLVYLSEREMFDYESYLSEFSYNSVVFDLSNGVPADLNVAINGSVNTWSPGIYPVTYTVTRVYGQMIYTGYAMLVVVVE